MDDRVKKSLWLPSTAVEELVIGAPVQMLAIVKTDGPRDSATSQAAEQAQGECEGPLTGALLAEGGRPAFQ